MRTLFLLGALASATAPLCAQHNFVTNGDFSAGITGWTEGGVAGTPGLGTYDTALLGTSACYECSPGGATYAPPHAPNWIEQQVLVIPSVPLEFSADFAIEGPSNNADGGAFWVEVGGVEVARFASGAYAVGKPKRLRVVARFTTQLSGMQALRINFARTQYIFTNGTPRSRVDNVALHLAPGPVLYPRGPRQVGAPLTVVALGEKTAPVAFFLSPGSTSGVQVPGLSGTLFLDPRVLVLFFSATLDGNGEHVSTFPVPNDPGLSLAPIWVQGAMVVGGQVALGNPQFLTFTP